MMPRRAGIALVLAIVVLLLVEVMTSGVLLLATQFRLGAAAHTRSLRAEAAAETAVAATIANWQSGAFDTLPLGRIRSVAVGSQAPDEVVVARVERLASATYVISATARGGGARAYAIGRSVALGRTLGRAALLQESNVALASGGPLLVGGDARLRAVAGDLPPEWADSLCPRTEPLPDPLVMLSAEPALVGSGVTVSGQVGIDSTLALTDSVALAGVKWSELESIADRVETGALTLAPRAAGDACLTQAAGNWGDPLHPAAPCGRYFPLVYAPGDLTISGVGQGILAVAGTLAITAGTHFAGAIVARDGITVEGDAHVHGSLPSRSGYALVDGANVSYSGCAVARAALATPSSVRLVLQQRRFIPAF